MQTLGITDATPRSDGWLKALFWPTIRNDVDVEYLTEQGFWICFTMSVVAGIGSAIGGNAVGGLLGAGFFFLAGLGMRMRSRAAAIVTFVVYLLSGFALGWAYGQPLAFMRIIFLALLLANIRGIWLSSAWPKNETERVPVLDLTWRDHLTEQWPRILWPRLEWLYYVLALVQFLGLGVLFFQHAAR